MYRSVILSTILVYLFYLTACNTTTASPDKKTGYITIADSKLYYETTGKGDAILFLHAGFMDRRMWEPQVNEFSKDHQVIVCDMRGHGITVDGDSSYYMYEALRILLDSLHIKKAVIAGLSLGAVVATDFAIQYPQYTEKLILAGPGINKLETRFAQDTIMFRRYDSLKMAAENKDTVLAAEYFVRSWFDGPVRKPADTDTAARAKALKMAIATMKTHRLSYWTRFAEPPAVTMLNKIAANTLIIVGEKDNYRIFVNSDTLQAYIPHTSRIVIPGTAHMMNMEKPVEFNNAVRKFIADK